MLELLCARTRRLWVPAREHVRHAMVGNRPCIMLVPEQYTLQAERDLINDLKLPGLLSVAVLSPTRLAQRVFEKAGAGESVLLDARGKRVAVARALLTRQSDLSYYKRAADKPGFVSALSDLISSLKEENLNAEALSASLEDIPDSLARLKLSDVAQVMAAYEEALGGNFTDAQGMRRDMLVRLPQSGILQDADVIVYGFDILTPPLRDTLLVAAKHAHSVLVTLVADKEQAEDGRVFSPVLKSAQWLMAALREQDIPARMRFLEETKVEAPEEIRHLEKHLMGFRRPAFAGAANAVRLLAAPTPFAEADFAARQVLLEMDRGIAAQDIVVLMGNEQAYGSLLLSRMAAYAVPAYLFSKFPVKTHGVVRCLLAALQCVSSGFRQEDVSEYLSSGFSPLTSEESWRLRNYAVRSGIKGRTWLKPFTRGSDLEKADAEPLRQKALAPIERMHAALLKAGDAAQSLSAVIDFLGDTDAYARITHLEQSLLDKDMPSQAAQTRQVWRKLIETFEQMYLLLRDERIPLKRFAQWLDAALENTEVSSLPPQSGCVQVGEIGRILPHEPKVVLLLGLNEGILLTGEDALMTDAEREAAQRGLRLQLGLTTREKENVRLLDFWKAISATAQRLYLTYALADEEGAVLRELSELKTIRAMLPGLVEEGGALYDASSESPVAPSPALDALADRLREGTASASWLDALTWLKQDCAWAERTGAVLRAAGGERTRDSLEEATAHQVFDTRSVSVSRLETYAACPFKYFVEAGLRPEIVKEWAVEKVDTGTFYHAALESFSRKAQGDSKWPEVDRAGCDAMMDEATAPLIAQWRDKPFGDTARARAASRGYLSVCRRAAWTLTRGMQLSSFRTEKTELRFGSGDGLPPLEIDLEDGTKLMVTGTIDRVDTCRADGDAYFRIIDYKSGNAKVSASDISAGLQLQLLIYLRAVLHAFPGSRPAGAFYQKVDDPMLKAGEDITMEEAERQIESQLRMSGIALKDINVFRLMDSGEPPQTMTQMFNKDGEARKNAAVVTQEELYALMDFALDKARDIAAEIRRGRIPVSPAVDKNGRGPCDYCEFDGICRRDPILRRTTDRLKTPMKLLDVVAQCKNKGI